MKIKVNSPASCSPAVFKFWIENAPTGVIVDWVVGTDTVVGGDTFEVIRFDPGYISASAIVTIPGKPPPCNKLIASNITRVYKVPEPNFSISKTTLCGITDTFTLIDLTPNAAYRIWIIEGQNNLTKNKTFVHQFTSNGTKDIILLVEDSFGCRGVKSFSNVAQVFENNDLKIAAEDQAYCLNAGVTYTSNVYSSNLDIASVKWNFPGGTPAASSTLTPPLVRYYQSGYPDVSLEVFTKQGCRLFKEVKKAVRLVDTIKLNIRITDSLLCLDDEVRVEILDTALTGNFRWDFPGNASIDTISQFIQKVTYFNTGNYPFQLIYRDSFCSSNFYKPVFITAKKVQAFFISKDNYNCVLPFTVHFENKSKASEPGTWKYTWTYFDSKNKEIASSNNVNDSILITKMGIYSVEIKAEHSSGCTNYGFVKDWIRADSTRLDFHAESMSVCKGQPISVVNMTLESAYLNNNSFKWWIYQADSAKPFDSSNVSQPFFVAKYDGAYDIRAKAINGLGCNDELTERKIAKVIKPQIGVDIITKSDICKPPAIISFRSKNIPDQPIYDHHWRLTDGVTSYDKYIPNDTILVHATGVYDLIYDIALGGYCRDTLIMKNKFYISGVEAKLNLTDKQYCRNQVVKPMVTVKNIIYNTSNDTVKYAWTCEPSVNVTILNADSSHPTYSFKNDGIYVIRAFVWNSLGCYANAYSDSIVVGLSHEFLFHDSITCADASVSFINFSDSFTNRISHLIEPNVAHTFSEIVKDSFAFSISKNGNYKLKLIVGHDSFCADTIIKNIQIVSPVADFYKIDSNLYCAPSYQRFVSISSYADTMFWDFGDGKTLKSTNPKLATVYLKNSGTKDPFDVRLIAKSRAGCSDTLIKKDYVMVKGPMAKFEMENHNGCEPLNVKFKGISENAVTLFLDHGDGTTFGTDFNKGHTYYNYVRKRAQQYYPMVLVIDDLGCVNTYVPDSIVSVLPSPKADFVLTLTKGCVPLKTEYFYLGKDAKNWYWDFNGDKISDGTRANGFWTYDVGGLYNATLFTNNDFSCFDTAFMQVEAIAIPKALIGFSDPMCLNISTEIIDKSLYGTAPLERDWAITDDIVYNFKGDSIINFSFKSPGQKQIDLKIKDAAGCSHDTIAFLTVKDSANSEKAILKAVTVLNDGSVSVIPSMPVLPYLRTEIWKQGLLGSSEFVKDTITNFVNHIDLTANTNIESRCYQIRHTDSCGFKSEFSDWHCTIYLTITSSVAFVNVLSWTPYIGWPVTKYSIYRSDGGPFILLGTIDPIVSPTIYTDSGLCNKNYCYYIVANGNQTFMQSQSNRVCKTPIYTGNSSVTSISNATVTASNSIEVQLTSDSKTVDHFQITRYTDEVFQAAVNIISTDSFYTDDIVKVDNHSYIYEAKAIDRCSDIGTSSYFGKTILLKGFIDSDTAHLTWTSYKDWPLGVNSYIVYVSTIQGMQKIGEVSGIDTLFKTSEKFNNIAGAYCYRVMATAKHDSFLSSFSNQVCLVSKGFLHVPNAFTPDGDGLNDVFKPVLLFASNPLIDPTGIYEFNVYSRWGQLIFQSNNPEFGWNGNLSGTKAPLGVYIYHVRTKALDGSMLLKTGSFSLLR